MNKTVTSPAGTVRVDTDPLAKLRADLAKAAGARVQVGVIGGENQRFDEKGHETLGNADIGLIHEFGVIGRLVKHKSRGQERLARKEEGREDKTVNMPERSFLRLPLIKRLPAEIYKAGAGFWRKLILQKGVVAALKALGIQGEATVQDAFQTGGFGHWPKLTAYTIKKKKSDSILIDTAQLRQSVTSRVVFHKK